MARVGFEPTKDINPNELQSFSFNHSDTGPKNKNYWLWKDSNLTIQLRKLCTAAAHHTMLITIDSNGFEPLLTESKSAILPLDEESDLHLLYT